MESLSDVVVVGCGPSGLASAVLDGFVRYGHWFRRELMPDLDRRKVTRIEKKPG